MQLLKVAKGVFLDMYQGTVVYECVRKRERKRQMDSTGPKIPKSHALMTTKRNKGREVVTKKKK